MVGERKIESEVRPKREMSVRGKRGGERKPKRECKTLRERKTGSL